MSDPARIHRSVTKIGGAELRPLHLLANSSSQLDTEASQLPGPSKSSKNVLKRRFPTSNNNLSFQPPSPPSKLPKTASNTISRFKSKPKANYHEFLLLDQAGEARIGNDNTKSCNLVAIKRRAWTGSPEIRCPQEIRHENVVNLVDIFIANEEVNMIYEQMDVSLELINGIPQGRWQAFEIAAICKEVR